ncbi:MAG: hypothetical protein WAQ56_09570 [Candidatus Nitrotoga sp.]
MLRQLAQHPIRTRARHQQIDVVVGHKSLYMPQRQKRRTTGHKLLRQE